MTILALVIAICTSGPWTGTPGYTAAVKQPGQQTRIVLPRK